MRIRIRDSVLIDPWPYAYLFPEAREAIDESSEEDIQDLLLTCSLRLERS